MKQDIFSKKSRDLKNTVPVGDLKQEILKQIKKCKTF